LLLARRLVTLTGAGGCGKTRLALQVSADLTDQFGDGVWLIELASLTDPALLPQTVADVLQVREAPRRPVIESLIASLRTSEMMLVLDNCEHLRAAVASLVDSLLKACPGLSILATSREKLGITGEQVYPVPPLSVPDPDHLPPLDQLREFEAVQLFADRAALSRPDFLVTQVNVATVARVCRRLDGIPLAIELAAARVKALSVEQIAAGLDDGLRLLTGGSRTALPRQQTVRASIDWSYALLTGAEQALLRRLSVFAGGWTLEGAEAVGSDGKGLSPHLFAGTPPGLPVDYSPPRTDLMDLLTQLVEKSLVLFEQPESEARYQLLETVRQYARDRLLESGEQEPVRRRHLEFVADLAEQGEAGLKGPEQSEWVGRLDAEHDNLRAGLDWAVESCEATLGLRLAGALTRFWEIRGHLKEGRERLCGMLALTSPAAATGLRAKALNAAARLADGQGDYTAMRLLVEESLELWRELGDQRGIGVSLRQLGDADDAARDYESARRYREESLAIFRALGDEREVMASLGNLGLTLAIQGNHLAARPFLEEGLEGQRKLGDQLGESYALNNLGIVALGLRDYSTAHALFTESLRLKKQLGNRGGVCWTLSGLAQVAAAQGEAQRAARLFAAADTERRVIGMDFPPDFQEGVAAVRAALGDARFAAAWAEGSEMSLEQAIADALREDSQTEPAS
jgi:non-specific serine/threonine protein kinase